MEFRKFLIGVVFVGLLLTGVIFDIICAMLTAIGYTLYGIWYAIMITFTGIISGIIWISDSLKEKQKAKPLKTKEFQLKKVKLKGTDKG